MGSEAASPSRGTPSPDCPCTRPTVGGTGHNAAQFSDSNQRSFRHSSADRSSWHSCSHNPSERQAPIRSRSRPAGWLGGMVVDRYAAARARSPRTRPTAAGSTSSTGRSRTNPGPTYGSTACQEGPRSIPFRCNFRAPRRCMMAAVGWVVAWAAEGLVDGLEAQVVKVGTAVAV